MKQRYIVLDRDGVINQLSHEYIKTLDELRMIENSATAISLLSKNNFKIFVATNQSVISRGLTTKEEVEKINMSISNQVARLSGKIESFHVCPHLPNDSCQCRKPETGLLKEIEKDYAIKLQGSFFIGDSLSDIKAALSHKMIPILVRTGHGLRTTNNKIDVKNVRVFDDLFSAVRYGVLDY